MRRKGKCRSYKGCSAGAGKRRRSSAGADWRGEKCRWLSKEEEEEKGRVTESLSTRKEMEWPARPRTKRKWLADSRKERSGR
ncbi:hypothetical protein MRB53_034436 [Persea americana]|uniref:Uncharacterized protein n=1 Tax=Persea americana TaxID=3435 RepID=A0ACC2K1W3_PERAE|nr:hypothetical protein MRB53_034436 [Persea americana]